MKSYLLCTVQWSTEIKSHWAPVLTLVIAWRYACSGFVVFLICKFQEAILLDLFIYSFLLVILNWLPKLTMQQTPIPYCLLLLFCICHEMERILPWEGVAMAPIISFTNNILCFKRSSSSIPWVETTWVWVLNPWSYIPFKQLGIFLKLLSCIDCVL